MPQKREHRCTRKVERGRKWDCSVKADKCRDRVWIAAATDRLGNCYGILNGSKQPIISKDLRSLKWTLRTCCRIDKINRLSKQRDFTAQAPGKDTINSCCCSWETREYQQPRGRKSFLLGTCCQGLERKLYSTNLKSGLWMKNKIGNFNF